MTISTVQAMLRRTMDTVQGKSCYILELSVQPGGSHWAELHTYTRLDHVRQLVERFFANDGNLAAYHALFYGATLGIWVVQRGQPVTFVDLHPHARVDLGDAGVVRLDDDSGVIAKLNEEVDEADDWEHYDHLRLEVSWDAIAAQLPALEPPLLAPGETTELAPAHFGPDDSYLTDEVTFGSFDEDLGEELDVAFRIDE